MFGASEFTIDPCKRHPGFNDFGTIIGAVAGPVISGLFGSSAADTQAQATQQAGAASTAATDRAEALQKQMYEEQVARQKPWLLAGENALAQLVQGTTGQADLTRPFSMADYQADPGYGFRMKEGMKALEQSAAARGGLLSGNMLKGAQRYGQDLASQEYQNAFNRYQTNQGNKFNRLASLAGVGQTAVSGLGQAGQQYGTSAGNIGLTSGANQANALLAAGQTRASSLGGWGQALGGVKWGDILGPSQSTYNNALDTLWG